MEPSVKSTSLTPDAAERRAVAAAARRKLALVLAGVFLVVFMVYAATLMPTVVDQDSGELAAASHVLGVPHPTGYPLWALLGRAFDLLPVGRTSAYRVALLSAACAAAASALVAWMAMRLAAGMLPGVIAGLAFGFWYPTWSQAARAEVYALAGLLTALSLVSLRWWNQERSMRALGWLAVVCGFASMHHRTAVLAVAPALIAALLLTRPRRLRRYLAAGVLFLLPFAFYAYLPIRAKAQPAMNWGDPSTLHRFLDHALGTQYQQFAFAHSPAEMLAVGRMLAPEVLAGQLELSLVLLVVGVPLIAWGAVRWLRKEPAVAVSLGIGSALLCVWVLQYRDISDLKVYLLPLGEVLALCGAAGVGGLRDRLRPPLLSRYLPAFLGLLVCATLVRANYERSDLSNVWHFRDRGVATLAQVDPEAIYISDEDAATFAALYLQNVEGLRPDVVTLSSQGIFYDWYVDLIEDAELRTAIRAARPSTLPPEEYRSQIAPLLAYRLAQELEGRRTVYVLRPPTMFALEPPPYFFGVGESLVKLQFERPDLLREKEPGPPLAEFLGGVKLVAFEWERSEAGNGELVEFRAEWQLERQVERTFFILAVRPPEMTDEQFSDLSAKARLAQVFPLLHGPRAIGPSPPGTVFEQRGSAIMPTNGPPGPYMTAVGMSRGEADTGDYLWAAVGEIRVEARPLPTNAP